MYGLISIEKSKSISQENSVGVMRMRSCFAQIAPFSSNIGHFLLYI